MNLCVPLQAMGEKSDAINALDESLKLVAENPFVENVCGTRRTSLLQLGILHLDMNRKDVALLHFRRAFNIDQELPPHYSFINLQFAKLKFFVCLIELRRFSEAFELFYVR
eukprot:m.298650 g.298650  ORF g.298650 m.298650 type:complete len:111 (+) comp40782_c0_seq83:2651-2983(+)